MEGDRKPKQGLGAHPGLQNQLGRGSESVECGRAPRRLREEAGPGS